MPGTTAPLRPAWPGRSARRVEPVDIVGGGVFSVAGRGLQPLARALAAPAPGYPDRSDAAGWPPLPVRPLTGFDAADVLGAKGVSRLTRTDQLAMAACIDALSDAGPGPGASRTGIVLGTAVGSPSTLLSFFRDTFEQPKPYLVNPSAFPASLMNSAAGKTAIRSGLTGLNSTVSGGPLAAMNALRYARRMLLGGRADRLIAGGVEELTPVNAWAWHRSGLLTENTALAEGAAVFALGLPGGDTGPRLGTILAAESGFCEAARGALAVADRLATAIRVALEQADVSPSEVDIAVPGSTGRRGADVAEARALDAVLPTARRFDPRAVVGETHAAGTALDLAALLAEPAAGGVAVLTAVGIDGSVGCLVVEKPDVLEES